MGGGKGVLRLNGEEVDGHTGHFFKALHQSCSPTNNIHIFFKILVGAHLQVYE